MSESDLILYAAAAAGVLLLLSVSTCLMIARRRGWGGAVVVLVLRLALLAVLAVLVRQAFWQFQDVDLEDDGERRKAELIVLEDRSSSMDFKSGSRTRRREAEQVWKNVERLAADHPAEPRVQRLLFAGNVVESKRAADLRRDSTQTAAALRRVFSLFQFQGVLVLSDGAATDGQPPQYVLDWARNRGLAIYAVAAGAGTDVGYDLVVLDTQNERTNPKVVRAAVGSRGRPRGNLAVTFELDGKPQARKSVSPGERQDLTFRLPDLEEGWHEYAVRVAGDRGEITQLNNVQFGIFQVVSPRKLLFIYDAPKLENRYLVQFLRDLYDRERVEVIRARDPRLIGLRARDYLLAIIGDVHPDRLPRTVQLMIRNRELTSMVLSGQNLRHWHGKRFPGYPISAFVSPRNFYTAEEPEGRVQVATENQHPLFRRIKLDSLRLNIIDIVNLTRSAETAFSISSGLKRYPFLIADRLESPRQLVLLSDTTWKWGLHPDPKVRSDYKAFWRLIMNWLVGDPSQNFELDLDLEAMPEQKDATRVVVAHPNPETSRSLQNVRLEIRCGDERDSARPLAVDDRWVLQWPNRKDRPAVVWFRASARSGARTLSSTDKPLLLPITSQELFDTRAQPEKLKALVGNAEEKFAVAGKEDALLKRLLDEFEEPDHQVAVRRRRPLRELIFAAIAVLLVGLEWLIERHLKAKP